MTESTATVLEFDRLPSTLAGYAKALAPAPGLKPGETVQRIEAHVKNVSIDPEHLRSYNEVCGFADAESVPVSFPHVLAAPLHMAICTNEAFPIALLGLVHVGNVINQHRRIQADEKLDFFVYLEGHREVDNGKEFDMVAEVRVGDELVWDSVTTFLRREKKSGAKKVKKKVEEQPFAKPKYERFELASNLGRRYAKVSGDFNPIHLYPATAKMLGFKRHIIHGMWSVAKCAALLESQTPDAVTMEVAFKLPAFLPTRALLKYQTNDDGSIDLRLLDGKSGEKPHLAGRLIPA